MKTVNARPLHPLTVFGLVALVIANSASYIIQHHTSLSERVADPLMGFLHGVAIGALLLGIWFQTRTLRSR